MYKKNGHIELISIASINFVDNGQSLQMQIIDCDPPYLEHIITFKNTFVINFFQGNHSGFPIIIIDLTWREVPQNEKYQIFLSHKYPIFDEFKNPIHLDRRLFEVHFEGSIVVDVLAEDVVIE